jgi:hypothetical protein
MEPGSPVGDVSLQFTADSVTVVNHEYISMKIIYAPTVMKTPKNISKHQG